MCLSACLCVHMCSWVQLSTDTVIGLPFCSYRQLWGARHRCWKPNWEPFLKAVGAINHRSISLAFHNPLLMLPKSEDSSLCYTYMILNKMFHLQKIKARFKKKNTSAFPEFNPFPAQSTSPEEGKANRKRQLILFSKARSVHALPVSLCNWPICFAWDLLWWVNIKTSFRKIILSP